MKKLLCMALALVMILSFAGCEKAKPAGDYAKSVDNALIVAEAGSAGEELATGNEYFKNAKFTAVDSMAKALMEVKAGTADVAIVDYVTSIGSIGEGTEFEDLVVVEGKDFNPEEYGVAFRKGSDITPEVNKIIAELMADGTMDKIGKEYKLDELLIKDPMHDDVEVSAESDLEYVKEKGELIIGITYFAPMNYEKDGELIGFETEFAKAVCEKLGVEAKFVEINWDTKEIELNSKTIDCIWNGMTITPERKENMSITVPYMNNKQVMVAKG
ncbi:MAG: transporter substrate-binding domain-containing protein [Ruminococcaceae bacterium]|nr:transporter substrate-binding domain-containing protein [Oscillospiraceae bacterium]